ncbi:hypothetical protein BJX64DRAFT_286644 [Aspergillus heterothallicus]
MALDVSLQVDRTSNPATRQPQSPAPATPPTNRRQREASSQHQTSTHTQKAATLSKLTATRSTSPFHTTTTAIMWTNSSSKYLDLLPDNASLATGRIFIETVAALCLRFTVAEGDRRGILQWIVEVRDYRASHLLPDNDGNQSSGLLISETVEPGLEMADHDFLIPCGMDELLTEEQARESAWSLTDHQL